MAAIVSPSQQSFPAMNSSFNDVSQARQRRKSTRHHDRAIHSKENHESISQSSQQATKIKLEGMVRVSGNETEGITIHMIHF